ncbi:hypothetical protein ACS7SF_13115 [Ralstonia sp. 25C]|uniref:hypothetical protein n=1 Tax=Ralstonia sp. 25C TaxID=3447363 RepID=UPI003F753E65
MNKKKSRSTKAVPPGYTQASFGEIFTEHAEGEIFGVPFTYSKISTNGKKDVYAYGMYGRVMGEDAFHEEVKNLIAKQRLHENLTAELDKKSGDSKKTKI